MTKGNWINHIDDLKEKVKVLREDKTRREEEVRVLKAIASELEGVVGKREKEVEEVGHQLRFSLFLYFFFPLLARCSTRWGVEQIL